MQKRQRVSYDIVVFPKEVWICIAMHLEWPEQMVLKLTCKRLFNTISLLDTQISKRIMHCFKHCHVWFRVDSCEVLTIRYHTTQIDHVPTTTVPGVRYFTRGYANNGCVYIEVTPNKVHAIRQMLELAHFLSANYREGCLCFERYRKLSGLRIYK